MQQNLRQQICERTYAFLKKQGWTNKIREIAGLSGYNMRLVRQGTAPVQFIERIRLAIFSYAKRSGEGLEWEEVIKFRHDIESTLQAASPEEYQELINEFYNRTLKVA